MLKKSEIGDKRRIHNEDNDDITTNTMGDGGKREWDEFEIQVVQDVAMSPKLT